MKSQSEKKKFHEGKQDVDIKNSREMSDAIVVNLSYPSHEEPRGDDHNYPDERD